MTTGSQKQPDVFIFGQDRTVEEDFVGITTQLRKDADENISEMNPNAIIEVSWTNKIEDELEKFTLQMDAFSPKLGDIKVGYLIKFIPLKKSQLPTEENPDRPLVGFDVYRMEKGAEGETVIQWRYGEDYPDDLKLTAAELGQGREGEGVSVPLKLIVDKLIQLGVKFQKPDKN